MNLTHISQTLTEIVKTYGEDPMKFLNLVCKIGVLVISTTSVVL